MGVRSAQRSGAVGRGTAPILPDAVAAREVRPRGHGRGSQGIDRSDQRQRPAPSSRPGRPAPDRRRWHVSSSETARAVVGDARTTRPGRPPRPRRPGSTTSQSWAASGSTTRKRPAMVSRITGALVSCAASALRVHAAVHRARATKAQQATQHADEHQRHGLAGAAKPSSGVDDHGDQADQQRDPDARQRQRQQDLAVADLAGAQPLEDQLVAAGHDHREQVVVDGEQQGHRQHGGDRGEARRRVRRDPADSSSVRASSGTAKA